MEENPFGKRAGRPPLMADLGFTEAERREVLNIALSLRSLRMSPKDIGKRLGVGEATITKWIREALQTQIKEQQLDLKELMQLELNELDHLQAVLAPNVEEGQLGAINTVLKVMESRRKLLGMDKPDTHEVNVSVRQIVGVNPDDI
jgi:hypothetical protein